MEASFVIGSREICRRFRNELGLVDRLDSDTLEGMTLEEKVRYWLKYGDVGLSSEATANQMLSESAEDSSSINRPPQPHDPDDLQRCRNLVKDIPEIRGRLGEMAALPPVWAILVEHWDELTARLATEESDENAERLLYERLKVLGC